MARTLTFIHAADLHLGAPVRGLAALSPEWARRVQEAVGKAWDNVVEAALSRKVDFVAIAGDLFDSAAVSYRDYKHLFSGLERLSAAGISAYLVTGNHDPFSTWQRNYFSLPQGITILPADKPGFALYEREGEPLCLIAGRGFQHHAWPQDACIAEGLTRTAALQELSRTYPQAAEAPFAVGILHTGLNIDKAKAPVSTGTLERADMDYWALGHIHKRHVYPSMDNPLIAFSGCTQGRDIQETGPHGVLAVTLTEGRPARVENVPTAALVWQRFSVDVADCQSLPAVVDKVMRETFRLNGRAHCEEMVSHVRLKGETTLHTLLNREDVLEELRVQLNESYPLFYCDVLEDMTRAPIDREALRREGLFPAVVLNLAQARREQPHDSATYLQQEFVARGISLPNSVLSSLDQLDEQAEALVLDLISAKEA